MRTASVLAMRARKGALGFYLLKVCISVYYSISRSKSLERLGVHSTALTAANSVEQEPENGGDVVVASMPVSTQPSHMHPTQPRYNNPCPAPFDGRLSLWKPATAWATEDPLRYALPLQ
jgi:hypothetical protein